MEVAVSVRVRDLLVVDLAEPVVGRDGAGVGQDQSADGVGHRRVLLDAPVEHVDIAVNGLFVIEIGGLHVAELLSLLAVEDVGLGDLLVARPGEHRLDAVLDIFDGDQPVLYLRNEVRCDLECQKVYDALVILRVCGIEGLADRVSDLRDVEIDGLPVTFCYSVHFSLSP